jgi:thymidylate synthase ThyX
MAKKQIMNNFTLEEEELFRAYLFTNPHGNDGFVYPNPLVAGEELAPLMSAVSRTHVSTQDRVLAFLDQAKPEQARALLPLIRPLMEIFRSEDGTLKVYPKTLEFNREWVIAHGHSSIKEGTTLFGHAEDISDIAIKKITGDPRNHPQVKSTRYISYKRVLDLALEDPDILALPNAGRFVEYIERMNRKYLETIDFLADKVHGQDSTPAIVRFLKQPEVVEAELNKWVAKKRRFQEDFEPAPEQLEKERQNYLKGLEDEAVRKDLGKFVLDYARVYLTAANRTSGVYAADARTIEDIITDLISSPRIEDQQRGRAIWNETRKIAPVLLGEKSHIKVDQWKVRNEAELRAYAQERFGGIAPRSHGKKMVNLLHPRNVEMYTDRWNAANVIFPYVDASITDIMAQLTEQDVREVLERAHKHRGEHDVIHPAICHGGLTPELTMGYHGYRDIFRQRRGPRTTQLLTTRLGFEVPEIFSVFGIDLQYRKDMDEAAVLYEEARKSSPHTAEKMVPFGALCRALHSWQVNQVGYVGRLRANIETGNISYVFMTRELIDAVSDIMPETGKYFRMDRRVYPPELWKRGYKWYDAAQRKT